MKYVVTDEQARLAHEAYSVKLVSGAHTAMECWKAAWNTRAQASVPEGEATVIHVNGVEDGGSILYVYPPIVKQGDKLYTRSNAKAVG